MPWTPSSLIVKGVEAAFHQKMDAIPQVWPNHCQTLNATTEVMPYAFPGFLPNPREFISGRQFQGILDFTFNVTNKEYELSFAIPRKYFEDDQTGLINARIMEAAEVWAVFKDVQFTTLLTDANVAGSNAWDGTVFHTDTRTIGSSANIDNNLTSAAATGTIPTAAEFIAAVGTARATMVRYQDDTGRASFNVAAITKLRTIIPPTYRQAAMEAVNSTLLGGGNSNPFGQGLTEIDELPHLTGDAEMWISAVGSERMPFIFAPRTQLEIVVNQSTEDVAKNNAIEVYCRQRYVFTYGEPRRNVLHTFS